MKINKIYIEKFGNISSKEIEFSDGFNFIYGIDEINKTTIIDFILMMFYGSVDVYNNDIREKYIPDEKSDMSGYICFEHDDTSYELYRIFNPVKRRKDKIILKNLTKETEEELSFDTIPVEHILGINKEIFRRNSYINESETVSMLKTSHTDIMSSMLSNLISTASEKISISEIANSLNTSLDTGTENTIASALVQKKERLGSLKEELTQAKETEKNKLDLQKECMQLQSDFEKYNARYEKSKDTIEYQEHLVELDALKNSQNSHQNFLEASRQYDEKNSQLTKTRVNKYKKEFATCCSISDNIKALQNKKEEYILRKKKIGVDLGRYTPKDNTEELDNICDTNKMIEETKYAISQLDNKLDGLNAKKDQLKDQIMKAEFDFQNASTDYAHFEEISKHKLLLAEEKLHNSSHKVSVEPIKESKNLIFASVLLVILSLLLIIYLNNILAVAFLLIGMATCIYAIAVKIRKEKKVNISRVDENKLRYAEIEMRNVKNKYNSDADRYKSQISMAKKRISDLKEQDMKLSDEVKNINAKITQSKNNLDFYVKQKSIAESKITQPDPKYYSLKSDIKTIESKIEKCDEEIVELSDKLIKELSIIKNVETCEEALEFIDSSSVLLAEIDELNKKLMLFSDKEKTEQAGAALKEKIAKIEARLHISDKDNIPTLSAQELLKLKEASASLREQTLEIKNQYLNSITNMKVQYNDGDNIACLEKEIEKEEKEVSKLEDLLRSVKLSIENYNEALSEMQKTYIPQVAKRASEILSELTSGKYTGITIKGGKIAIKDQEHNIMNFASISKATCDQIYFSLRLAICEITENRIHTPLILDDIFLRYNETKATQLLKFLTEYPNKSQILIFSHHNQVSNLAANGEISIDNINMISMKKK
ncbi:MAG: AAA family ATPase [Oscillospiraceae bacterium]|nr:AAA family ATPase [Oscillospiraceae bacterium]